MIAWLILGGLALLLIFTPAIAFGWLCGLIVCRVLRRRKPPLPPPIR